MRLGSDVWLLVLQAAAAAQRPCLPNPEACLGCRFTVEAAIRNTTSATHTTNPACHVPQPLARRYPNIEAMGHLNQTEVNLLWSYQRMTGARALKFGAWPTNVRCACILQSVYGQKPSSCRLFYHGLSGSELASSSRAHARQDMP